MISQEIERSGKKCIEDLNLSMDFEGKMRMGMKEEEDGKLEGRIPKQTRGTIRKDPEPRFVPFYFGYRGEACTTLSELSLPRAF